MMSWEREGVDGRSRGVAVVQLFGVGAAQKGGAGEAQKGGGEECECSLFLSRPANFFWDER